MGENTIAPDSDKMHAPSYKLLVTTPMAAIMLSGKQPSQWPGLLASIGPVYASAVDDTLGEVKEALSAASTMLQGGETVIGQYFLNEDLDFNRLMEISATGADVWMCKLSDGEIKKPDLIKLFQAIQAGLIAAVGDLRDDNEMIDQLIHVQDKVIEHISSLN